MLEQKRAERYYGNVIPSAPAPYCPKTYIDDARVAMVVSMLSSCHVEFSCLIDCRI